MRLILPLLFLLASLPALAHDEPTPAVLTATELSAAPVTLHQVKMEEAPFSYLAGLYPRDFQFQERPSRPKKTPRQRR